LTLPAGLRASVVAERVVERMVQHGVAGGVLAQLRLGPPASHRTFFTHR
jgi:hypothetical protein